MGSGTDGLATHHWPCSGFFCGGADPVGGGSTTGGKYIGGLTGRLSGGLCEGVLSGGLFGGVRVGGLGPELDGLGMLLPLGGLGGGF